MTSFVEKLVAEIVVSLGVGAVLAVISLLLPAADEGGRQNRRPGRSRCGADPAIEAEPAQLRQHQLPQQ